LLGTLNVGDGTSYNASGTDYIHWGPIWFDGGLWNTTSINFHGGSTINSTNGYVALLQSTSFVWGQGIFASSVLNGVGGTIYVNQESSTPPNYPYWIGDHFMWYGTLNNSGTMKISSSEIIFGKNGRLINNPGGLFSSPYV